MGLRRRLTAGVAWAVIEVWGQRLASLGIFLVLARLLGPEAYGLVRMAVAVTALGDVFITSGGWSEALIQRKDLEPEHGAGVFWLLVPLALVLTAACVAAAPLAAAFFDRPAVAGLVVWLSLTLPLGALTAVPTALLRRELRFRTLALRSHLATIGGGAVGIGMALTGWGIWSLVGQQLAQRVIGVLVLWTAHPWRPAPRLSWRHVRDLGSFGLLSLGDRLLLMVDGLLPRLLIGHFLGAAPLGHFLLARTLLELLTELLVHPLSRVAMPAFARLQGQTARLRDVLAVGTRAASLVAFPSFLGLAVVAPELVPVAFGAAWSPSVPVVQIVALVGLIFPITNLGVALLRGLGRVGWQLGLTLVASALLAALMLLASHSIVAMAWAVCARAYAMLPLRLATIQRAAGIPVAGQVARCLPVLLAALLMAAAVFAWRTALAGTLPPVALLATSVLVGVVNYGGMALLVERAPLREARDIVRSLRPSSAAAAGGGRPPSTAPLR